MFFIVDKPKLLPVYIISMLICKTDLTHMEKRKT